MSAGEVIARGSACETKALASLYLPDPSIGVRREQRTLDKGGSSRRAPLQPPSDDSLASSLYGLDRRLPRRYGRSHD